MIFSSDLLNQMLVLRSMSPAVGLRNSFKKKNHLHVGEVDSGRNFKIWEVINAIFIIQLCVRESYIRQDAREAMSVVFFCTRKTYLYAQNEISYEYIQILF